MGGAVIIGAVIWKRAWDSPNNSNNKKVADQMYRLDPDCVPFAD